MKEQHTAVRSPRAHVGDARKRAGPITSLTLELGILGLLVWQFSGAGGSGLQVLDPELHLMWKAAILVLVIDSFACKLAVWLGSGWTMRLATVNAVVNVVSASVLITLIDAGELFAPTLPSRIGSLFEANGDWVGVAEPAIIFIAGTAFWDGLAGVRGALNEKGHADYD